MGAFSEGNFDNDAALDARQEVLDYLVDAIKEFTNSGSFCVEDTDSTMAYIEMLTVILAHTSNTPHHIDDPELMKMLKGFSGSQTPDLQTVTGWKNRILKVYDDEIDGLMPDPEYKVKRREVIETALNRLETLCS